jgi:hypothetical protein
VQQGLDGIAAEGANGAVPALAAAPPTVVREAWPRDRYDQIKAVRDLVAARPGTYTAGEVASAFKSAPQATVARHLRMLERIGFLVGYDDPRGRRWHAQG